MKYTTIHDFLLKLGLTPVAIKTERENWVGEEKMQQYELNDIKVWVFKVNKNINKLTYFNKIDTTHTTYVNPSDIQESMDFLKHCGILKEVRTKKINSLFK